MLTASGQGDQRLKYGDICHCEVLTRISDRSRQQAVGQVFCKVLHSSKHSVLHVQIECTGWVDILHLPQEGVASSCTGLLLAYKQCATGGEPGSSQ